MKLTNQTSKLVPLGFIYICISKSQNSSGYVFKSLSVCDDKEIQDIVQN